MEGLKSFLPYSCVHYIFPVHIMEGPWSWKGSSQIANAILIMDLLDKCETWSLIDPSSFNFPMSRVQILVGFISSRLKIRKNVDT